MSRPQKFLIYLDQNFISEMAKLGLNDRVNPDFHRLFDVLHRGFRDEKLVALRSTFHEVETSLSGHLRGPIRSRQATLGHVHLRSPYAVKERQLQRALQVHVNGHGEIICYEDVMQDDPDQRVGHLDIDVNMDWRFAGAQEERADLAARLDVVRKRLAASATTYDEQYRIELSSERENMLSRANTAWATTVNEVSAQTWREFVLSDAFAHVPIIDLEVSLMARLLTSHPNRPIRQGDMADFDAMAAYLPYSDAYATDAFAATLARSVSMDTTYSCPIFDARRQGVRALIDHVIGVLDTMKPVNNPSLSFFVAAEESVKEDAFSFYRQLGLQAKSAECDGQWVEIFGFDDGTMPRYKFKPVPDAVAPFYGLQEVTVVPCAAEAPIESLLATCRSKCRSSRFVFIDQVRPLPADFVKLALITCITGEAEVCGYSIHNAES